MKMITVKDVAASVTKCLTAYVSFRDLLEVAAANVAYCAQVHGNTTPANDLLNGLGLKDTAVRTTVLREWLVAFGPFMVIEKTKDAPAKLVLDRERQKLIAKGDVGDWVQSMRVEPFYKWKPANPDWKGFNLKEALEALIKKGDGAIKKHAGDALCVVTEAQQRALREFAAKV